MANLPLAFAELLLGAVILDAGIKGAKIGDVVKGTASLSPITGLNPSSSSTTPSATPSGPSGGGQGASLPSGGQTHGLVSIAALTSVGAKHGWSPSQILDWMKVVMAESNGTLTDTNPSSGAYGIAQFINGPSEYAQYGGNSTTLDGQLTAMANYIAQRYGNPSAAWAHEQSNHWY